MDGSTVMSIACCRYQTDWRN